MNRFRDHLISASVLSVLAIIAMIVNSRPVVHADNGPQHILIDPSQLPLPVQGSTSVSGTVATTQSGAWNVGITGTPNVKVTNVTNDADQPVTASGTASIAQFGISRSIFTVPTGKRLVIEYLSGYCSIPVGQTVTAAIAYTNSSDGTNGPFASLPMTPPAVTADPGPFGSITFGGPLRAYAEPGPVQLVFTSNLSAGGNCGGTIIGHLISMQ